MPTLASRNNTLRQASIRRTTETAKIPSVQASLNKKITAMQQKGIYTPPKEITQEALTRDQELELYGIPKNQEPIEYNYEHDYETKKSDVGTYSPIRVLDRGDTVVVQYWKLEKDKYDSGYKQKPYKYKEIEYNLKDLTKSTHYEAQKTPKVNPVDNRQRYNTFAENEKNKITQSKIDKFNKMNESLNKNFTKLATIYNKQIEKKNNFNKLSENSTKNFDKLNTLYNKYKPANKEWQGYNGLTPAEKMERSEAITQKWIEKYTPYRKEGSNLNPRKWGYAIVDTPFAFGRNIPALGESTYRITEAGLKNRKLLLQRTKENFKSGAVGGVKGTYEMAKNPGNWPMLIYQYKISSPGIKEYQNKYSNSAIAQQIRTSAKEFDPRGQIVKDQMSYNYNMLKQVPKGTLAGMKEFGKSAISKNMKNAVKYNYNMLKQVPRGTFNGMKTFAKSSASPLIQNKIKYNYDMLKQVPKGTFNGMKTFGNSAISDTVRNNVKYNYYMLKKTPAGLKQGLKSFGNSAVSDTVRNNIKFNYDMLKQTPKGLQLGLKEFKNSAISPNIISGIDIAKNKLSLILKNGKTINTKIYKIGDKYYAYIENPLGKNRLKDITFEYAKKIEITEGLKKLKVEKNIANQQFHRQFSNSRILRNKVLENLKKEQPIKKIRNLSLEEKQTAWKGIADLEKKKNIEFTKKILDDKRFSNINIINKSNKFSKLNKFFKEKNKIQNEALNKIREIEKSNFDKKIKQAMLEDIKNKYEIKLNKGPNKYDFPNEKSYYKYVRDVQKGREVGVNKWNDIIEKANKDAKLSYKEKFIKNFNESQKKNNSKKTPTKEKEIETSEGQILLQKEESVPINKQRKEMKQKFEEKMKQELEPQSIKKQQITSNKFKQKFVQSLKYSQQIKQKQLQQQKQLLKQEQKQIQKQKQEQKQIQRQEFKYEYKNKQKQKQTYKTPFQSQKTKQDLQKINTKQIPTEQIPKPNKNIIIGNISDEKYNFTAYKVEYTKNGIEKTLDIYKTKEEATKATQDLKRQGINIYRIIPIVDKKIIGNAYRKTTSMYQYKTKNKQKNQDKKGFLLNALKEYD